MMYLIKFPKAFDNKNFKEKFVSEWHDDFSVENGGVPKFYNYRYFIQYNYMLSLHKSILIIILQIKLF